MMSANYSMQSIWQPHAGSQYNFMECPAREILFAGTRGPGKTDAMLMKFHKHVGQYGAAWRGVIFATRYKNLDEIVTKGKKWFFQANNGCRFLGSKDTYKFVWKGGEELLLRIAEKDDDYWNYHGHEYPFVAWEELTKWATPHLYDAMFSVNRSSVKGIPKYYIATTNPYGAGHNWVKERWIDPNPTMSAQGVALPPIGSSGGNIRVRFDGDILENTHLLAADPDYLRNLDNIQNEVLKRAWRYGDWEINVGAFFDGYLSKEVNMIPPMLPPLSWRRWKAFDWGSRKPYSIGYYAQDPEGPIVRYREIYGCTGEPDVGTGETTDEICANMTKIERFEVKSGVKFINNPADDSIFSRDGREKTIAEEYAKKENGRHIWVRAQKNFAGRVNGWELLRQVFKTGNFLCTSDCTDFWRTMPNLMPDEKKWEDILTTQEDHIADEVRYSVVSRHMKKIVQMKGSKEKSTTRSLKPADKRYSHLTKSGIKART